MKYTDAICLLLTILLAISEYSYGMRTSAESALAGNDTSSESLEIGYNRDTASTHTQCRNFTLYTTLINEGCTDLKTTIRSIDVHESCRYMLKEINACLDAELEQLGYNCSWYDFRLIFERNKVEMGKLFEVDFKNCTANPNPCRSFKFMKEVIERNCRNVTDLIRNSTTAEERCRLVDKNLTTCIQDELRRWRYNCTGDDFEAIQKKHKDEMKRIIGTEIDSCTDKKCFNYTLIRNITEEICPNLRLADNKEEDICRAFSKDLLVCVHKGISLRGGLFCRSLDYIKSFREHNTSVKETYGQNALQCLEYERNIHWVKLVLLYVYTTPLDCKTGQVNQTLQNTMKQIITRRIHILSPNNRRLCMNNDCPLLINAIRVKVKSCSNITNGGSGSIGGRRKRQAEQHEVDIEVIINKIPKTVVNIKDGRVNEVGQMFKRDFEIFRDSYRNNSQSDMIPLRLGVITCDALPGLHNCVDEQGENVSSEEDVFDGPYSSNERETTTMSNSNVGNYTGHSGNSSSDSRESGERPGSTNENSSEQQRLISCPAKCFNVCPKSLNGCEVTLSQVEDQFKNIFSELTAWNVFRFMNCPQMYKIFRVYTMFRKYQPDIKTFFTAPTLMTLERFRTIGSIETILSSVIPNLKTEKLQDIFQKIPHNIKRRICNLKLGCISDTLVFGVIANTCIENESASDENDDDEDEDEERSVATQYRIIEYLQQNKAIAVWTCDDIKKAMKFPDAIKTTHIQSFSNSSIIECADRLREKCKRIDISVRKVLVTRVKNLLDTKEKAGLLESKTKRKLKILIGKCGGDKDDIVKALTGTKQDKLQMLRNMSADISEMDDALKTEVKDVMFQSLIPEGQTHCNASGLSKEDLYELVTMALDDKSKLKCFTDAQLKSVMCDIGANCSCSNAKLVLIKRRVGFSLASKDCKMKMLSAMDETELESTDTDDLKTAVRMGYIKKAKVSTQQGISILKKINSDVYDKSTLENLGNVKAFMKVKHISKITTMDADVVKSFEKSFEDTEDDTNSATREGFIRKALEENQIGSVSESSMHKWLSAGDFANAQDSELSNLFGETGDVLIKCKKKAAPYLYKKVIKVLGRPKSSNLNWTSTRIVKFSKSCVLCGMPLEDIDQLPDEKDIFDTLGNLPCLSIKQEVSLSERYKQLTKVDGSQTPPSYSESEIKAAPPQLLSRYSDTVLRRFGSSNTENVWKRLAKVSMRTMSKKEIRRTFETFLNFKGKQSGTIDTDTLLEVGEGDLLCGMTTTFLERSNLEVMKKFLAEMLQKCPFDSSEKSTFTRMCLQKLGMQISQITEKELLMFGPGLLYFTESELDQLKDIELMKIKLKISKMIKRMRKTLRKRIKSSFTLEIDKSEMRRLKTVKNKFFKRMRTAIRNTEAVRNRKRRSVDTVTCDDLKGMEDIASSLTIEQINNIAHIDFQNCLDGLGKVTDYTDEQKLALANVAKRVYGIPSSWSEDMLISAGVIIQGLTQEEISTLQLTIDSIAVLGKFDDWDKAKKKAVIDRYLVLHKNGDTSTLTNTELRSFEHFACAMDTTQISTIQAAVYGNSADLLGDVTSCEEMQYLEYGKLAKQVYGAVTTWESPTIAVVGVMIAGLTKSDIPLLSAAQIEAISSVYIPYIPATTFSAFTPSQIGSFSTSQALITTEEQRQSLTSEQLMALEKVAGMSLVDPTSGTKKTFQITIWLVLPIVMSLIAVC